MPTSIRKSLAVIAAAVAAVFGAMALGRSGSSSSTAAAGATPPGQQGAAPPQGFPGRGTDVTGAAAEKVKTAALARYPGTIEHIEQRPDGSYVAHVIRSDGTEIHVLVSKTFGVTDTETGPPGGQAPLSTGQTT
jgi:hypothetical protein